MTSASETGKPAAPKGEPMPIRDAATLILVDTDGTAPRILMGKRRMDVVFMPGKYVFPGGRVDEQDLTVPLEDDLAEADRTKLLFDMKGTPSLERARAMALAAIRETFEEAGILIGRAAGEPLENAMPSWQSFFAQGVAPRVSALTFFARAITPPGRSRRYDTRFFCAETSSIARRTDTRDGELSGLHWLTIEEARGLDLPSITRVILEDLNDRIRAGHGAGATQPVPYYHHTGGSFRRDVID
jgi:8-oxo-dGTP pyrophosphatase MutT (NUDIX family)